MISDLAELFDGVTIVGSADRRLTRRVVDVWTRAARGAYPSWAEMRRVDLGEDWNWVFVVDLKQSVGFPYFVYLGGKLAKLSDVYLSGASDWTLSLLDKATVGIDAAVAEQGPHFMEDELVLCDRRQILFRSMTAPLADDGVNISHVLGAVSGQMAPAEDKSTLRAV